MSTHVIRLSLFAMLLLCAEHSSAQTTRSRQDFIDAALNNSAALRAASARVRSAEASRRRASAWEAPTVAFEFYATPVTSLNPLRDGLENDYSIQQMIMFPGKIGRMEDMADAGIRMRRENVETAKRAIIAEVKSAYAMLTAARNRRNVNRDNITLLEQIATSSEAAYAVGRGGNADIQRLRSELGLLRNEGDAILAEEQRALAMLAALTGEAVHRVIGETEVIALSPLRWNADSLADAAVTARPDLRAMRQDIEMQDARARLARRQWLPDLMVRAMYKEMTMGMPDHWSLMFGVSVPIAPWSSGGYAGAVEEAEADARAAQEQLEDMRRMAEYEVRDAWAVANGLWERLTRFRESIIPHAEQALQAAMTSYATGGGDFATLLDAARMLAMFRMDAEMLEGDYHVALARLERAVGTDLGI
ncbi:MAG: TolC family protein [Bacteroidia bacterium]|nr:TolC family protein [Bacteroidia bacterium]